jgi:hypothetical protein
MKAETHTCIVNAPCTRIRARSVIVGSFAASIVLLCLVGPATAGPVAQPDFRRVRAALERPVSPPRLAVTAPSISAIRPGRSQAMVKSGGRDSVWDGVLIGLGIGAAGGLVWGRHICGGNDSECFAIAGPVGVLGGAGIGAAIGAIVDALHK